MIQEIIFNKNKDNEDLINGLTFCLIFSLIFSLIFGLINGLIFSLIFSLIFGLIFSLIFSLIFGLIFSLIFGLNYFTFLGLASLISHYPTFIPIWLLIIIFIVLVEIIFWIDPDKPKNKSNKFLFTCWKKLTSTWDALFIIGSLNLIRLGIIKLKTFEIPYEIILKWIGYIGVGIIALGIAVIALGIVVGIIYLWIKVNSLKYRR